MTIRVRCDGCSAVMKVKDELAGAKGKCPKCKSPFVVPEKEATASDAAATQKNDDTSPNHSSVSDEQENGTGDNQAIKAPKDSVKSEAKPEGAATASSKEAATLEAPIDLPLEPTPQVPAMDSEEFDPLSALAPGSNTSIPAMTAVAATEPVNKPSVADLMKEHSEKKGRRTRRQEKTKTSKAAQLAQPVETSGSAADALNRKYDQKRDEAADSEKLMTREERRQSEQKEAMIDFAKKGIPALAGVLLLSYGLISYMFSVSLPPLGYASGTVTRNGTPLSGVQVVFAPKAQPGQAPPDNSTVSQGFTDSSGKYTLMYNQDNEGVLPGYHEVSIMSSSGMMFTLPTEKQFQTIQVDEDHALDFNF
ncbi:MAG: hypothetical protein ABJZ55_04210 [Fuerstiella sp.]